MRDGWCCYPETSPIPTLGRGGKLSGRRTAPCNNYKNHKWVPALSAGFMVRTGVRNVGNQESVERTYENQSVC